MKLDIAIDAVVVRGAALRDPVAFRRGVEREIVRSVEARGGSAAARGRKLEARVAAAVLDAVRAELGRAPWE